MSTTSAFYTGDSATARFPLDLSTQTSTGRQYDAITSNIRTGQVYSLGNGTTPLAYGGGTVTSLIALDGTTGVSAENDMAEPPWHVRHSRRPAE